MPPFFYLVVAASMTGGLESVPIGPMPEAACRAMAAAAPQDPAQPLRQFRCRRAYYTRSCPVDGYPGVYRACPVFDRDEDR